MPTLQSILVAALTLLYIFSTYVLYKYLTRNKYIIKENRDDQCAQILKGYNRNSIGFYYNELSVLQSTNPHLRVAVDNAILKEGKHFTTSCAVETAAWFIFIDVCKKIEDNSLYFTIISVNKTNKFDLPEIFNIIKSIEVKSNTTIQIQIYKDVDY